MRGTSACIAVHGLDKLPYLTVRRQARVIECSFHQLNQEIQYVTQTISYVEKPLLQGAQAGNFLGYIKAKNLAITV